MGRPFRYIENRADRAGDLMYESAGNADEPWSVYRCLTCGGAGLDGTGVIDGDGYAECKTCHSRYPVTHHILDALIEPTEAVIHELGGMAVERGLKPAQWADVKIRCEDHVNTLEELLNLSVGDAVQYYQQTTITFDQAAGLVDLAESGRVLEIGAQTPYYFLEHFRRPGFECFALNIIYFYQLPDHFGTWPHKALADMNGLPYCSDTFDLVILSATAHHSGSLEQLFVEIARVLRPGGHALVLNEPVEGLLKRLSGRKEEGRDEHIHEGRYRVWEYTNAVRLAGLSVSPFFSDFFDRTLSTGHLHEDTRFVWLGRVVARFWRNERFRHFARTRLLWVAQATVGFPFNAIVQKPLSAAMERLDA